jgi:hypothetical protein
LHIVISAEAPSWWIADFWVNVFQRDWEVDVEKVEVFEAPVCELLAADGLDLLAVVEGVPEFGDDEEIFALYETFLDGTSYSLSTLNFVTVV